MSAPNRLKLTFGPSKLDLSSLGGPVNEAEFAAARNAVIEVCMRFGTVGPVGVQPTVAGNAPAPTDPDFYVVDNQYGDSRVVVVEPKLESVSTDWLFDLGASDLPAGWEIVIWPGDGIELLVGPSQLHVSGWNAPENGTAGDVSAAIIQYICGQRSARASALAKRASEVSLLVPGAWAMRPRGGAVSPVATYATRSDGVQGDSIWLLHFEDRTLSDLDHYEFEPEALRLSVYLTDRTGSLRRRRTGETPPVGTALLVEWVLVARGLALAGAPSLRVSAATGTWVFSLLAH